MTSPRLIILLLLMSPMSWAQPALVQLGTPDGSCAEFGLVDKTWTGYATTYPKPIDVVLGQSALTAWPYIHPSTRDTWAGGKPHTFTLRFDLPAAPAGPQWLHLGYLASWEPSRIRVTINGAALLEQRLPAKNGTELAFDPYLLSEPSDLAVAVAPERLRAGANELAITLDDGSWIIYDYVLLGAQQAAPVVDNGVGDLLERTLAGPMADVDSIIFALRKPVPEHWYANFSYFAPDTNAKTYRPGGRLCRLNPRTGVVETLLDDAQGGVRDPAVSHDGQRVLFSWRRGASDHYNLYEMTLADRSIRPITSGEWDDIEPAYLPDGGIVFVSSRCRRWVNCWLTQVAVLYRCEADGSGLRPLSSNNEHDNTPWVMPDGRILYTRWEYVDRSQVHYHHLWSTYPDGTVQEIWFGNQRPGDVFIDAKPIPGSHKIVASFSPGHGKTEHEGRIGIIDPKAGPDQNRSARAVTRGDDFRDPWAFDETSIMAARGGALMLCDERGRTAELYRLPEADQKAGYWLHEPRPVMGRPRERVIPTRTDLGRAQGRFLLQDVHLGRNMEGVRRGEIKKLLVLESLPKPVNFTGGMEPLSYGGTFTLERILGTVPVEPDGSAYFEAPALRSLIFVALDQDDLAVKRMQSFATVQPGETLGCVGCHEHRTQAPPKTAGGMPTAMRRQPSSITPIPDVPDVIDYPRDIQPIWDRHCVNCHRPEKRDGGVNLVGHRGPMFTLSYFALTARSQVADGRNRPVSNYPPRRLGSSASPLMAKLTEAHHGVRMSDLERRTVRLWTEVGAPHPGTYAALGCGMIGGYAQNSLDRTDLQWPATKAGGAALQRRCASCHTGARTLPQSASDEIVAPPWEDMGPQDPRRRYARHLLYDLSEPDRSALLLAPLARAAGGWQSCGDAVFADTGDADYAAILGMVRAAGDHLESIKRFDMAGFRPRSAWVREMQRYGILPADMTPTATLDPYSVEQRYWASLWWQPID